MQLGRILRFLLLYWINNKHINVLVFWILHQSLRQRALFQNDTHHLLKKATARPTAERLKYRVINDGIQYKLNTDF